MVTSLVVSHASPAPPPTRVALDLLHLYGFSLKVAQGVVRFAQDHPHWRLFVNHPDFTLARQLHSPLHLAELGIQGIIYTRTEPEFLHLIRRLNLPHLHIYNESGLPDEIPVASDDSAIGRLAARHLLECGLSHFAFLGPGRAHWHERLWTRQRWDAFSAELADHGIRPRFLALALDAFERASFAEQQHAATVLQRDLAALPRPFALFAADDHLALYALECCHAASIAVPRDAAILGVNNNLAICECTRPTLSSIDNDAQHIGYEKARLLDALIHQRPRPSSPLLVPPRDVVVRESTNLLAIHDPVLRQTIRTIDAHLTEPLNLAAIARSLNVSPGHISRTFKLRTGWTFRAFVRRRRIDRAKQLLTQTQRTLADIAADCGFANPVHFSHAFRDLTGTSPARWRQGHRPLTLNDSQTPE